MASPNHNQIPHMKINIRTQALLLGATLLGTILFTGTPAAAVNITNTVDEVSLTASNWNSSVWGTPAAVPLATTNYFINVGSIRTVATNAAQSFNGATLTLLTGKILSLKHGPGVATVNLLTGGGGPSSITYAGGSSGATVPLGGTLTVNNSVTIGQNQSGANTRDIWLLSTLSGASAVTVDQRGSSLVLFGTNTAFSGAWKILTGNLQIGNGASNALGTNSVTFTTVSTPVSLIFNSTNNFTVSNTISGPGSVIKQNTGTVTLAGANTFVGTVQVSSGVLKIGAGSSLATATNITLSGGTLDAGPIGGLSLAANETINGCNGTVISNLTAATGNILNFNLSTPTNDVLNVTGSLTLSGAPTLNLTLASYKPTGTYRLINYTGSILGGGAFTLVPPGGGATYTLDTATPGQVNLLVTNPVYSLTWVGDGSVNSWDSSSPNWTGAVAVYGDGDSVTFNDSGSATPNIAVATTVYPAAMTVNNTSKQYVFDGAGISCLGSLTKLGSNELDLTSTNNYFTGPVTISAGILSIGNGGNTGSLGSPSVITNNGVFQVNMTTNTVVLNCSITGSGSVVVTNNVGSGTPILQLSGTNSYTGPTTIGNSTAINLLGSSGLGASSIMVLPNGRLGVSGFAGVITVTNPILVSGTGQALYPGALYANTAGNNVTWAGPVTLAGDTRFRVVNPGVLMNFSNTVIGTNINLQCTEGSSASDTATTMTFLKTLSLGSSGSLTKDGQGVLVLAGNTNEWGATTVNSGNLLVNGRLDGGTVTVNSSATVGGAGTILGGVSVQAGGTLAPGNAGIGTLTLSNTVALDTSAVTLMEINRTNAQNADRLVASAIPFDGTLTVVNTGPALQAGDSFYLFAGTISGAFAATNLPALSSTNLLWDTSLLASSGVIKVAANTAPMPTITQPAVSGTNFTLQVTSSAVGFNYVLQATPSLAPAIWTGVQTNAGTGGTLNFSIPITPGNPQLFFRINVQ